ncbi:DUF6578 domain-containing protein [Streptomyces sp. G45]|uniref:DUF6578 domain-containing protein n=1 Tax=Streptomyces sp. G45 TaxID=3406627 RepID=UPI003C1B8832
MKVGPEDYADLVGRERAAGIGFREEHHGEAEGAPTSLRVTAIDEVHCRYAVPPGSTDSVHYPVAGSTVLVPVEEADGWAAARPDVRFSGYLVTAEPATDVRS